MKPQHAHSNIDQPSQAKTRVEPLWTVDDVANYLRLKPETVRIMARDGKLPCRKVGRSWRFSSKEISDWVSKKSS